MAATSTKKAVPVPLPTESAKNAFQAFVNVKSRSPLTEKDEETLEKLWKNASSEMKKKIEDAYPGTEEKYVSGGRRKRTRKTKKRSKKTLRRRH